MLLPNPKWNEQIYRVSDKISDKEACLIEPFTVGCRAARRSFPKKGENAVVFGAGTIGIAAAIALKYFGCEKVMVCDHSDLRLKKAENLGMETCNNGREDVRDVMNIMESSRWDIESIITHEFPWERLPEAIETAADIENSLNVVIRYDR